MREYVQGMELPRMHYLPVSGGTTLYQADIGEPANTIGVGNWTSLKRMDVIWERRAGARVTLEFSLRTGRNWYVSPYIIPGFVYKFSGRGVLDMYFEVDDAVTHPDGTIYLYSGSGFSKLKPRYFNGYSAKSYVDRYHELITRLIIANKGECGRTRSAMAELLSLTKSLEGTGIRIDELLRNIRTEYEEASK